MRFAYTKILKYFFLLLIIGGAVQASASIISGSISSTNYTAQVCEDASCTVTTTSPVNFGYFTTQNAYNVLVADTQLTGYIWGKSFGWVVLNCSNTTSGCSSTNGNFKVANNYNGTLSGYAWGETSGWVNFGPFTNSATAQVTINTSGEFNGYAWSQNFGWIKFDCSSGSYCVKTDWRPRNSRPQCSDGLENDNDNYIDSADSGCHTDGNVNNAGSYDPTKNLEYTQSGRQPAPPAPTPNPTPTPTPTPSPTPTPTNPPTQPTPTPTPKPKPTPSNPPSKPIEETPDTQPAFPPIASPDSGENPFAPSTSGTLPQPEQKYLAPFLRSILSGLNMIPDNNEGTQTPKPSKPAVKKVTKTTPQTIVTDIVEETSSIIKTIIKGMDKVLNTIGNFFNSLF